MRSLGKFRNPALRAFTMLWVIWPLSAQAQTTCSDCDIHFLMSEVPVVEHACSDGNALLALPNFPAYTDNCSDDFWTAFFRHSLSTTHTCFATDAEPSVGVAKSLRIQGLIGSGVVQSDLFTVDDGSLTWTTYPEVAARLQGNVRNVSNPEAIFTLDLYFEEKFSAEEWTNGGGNLDLFAPGSDPSNWEVWALKPHMSKLIGSGSLEGTYISLSPTSLTPGYGFQIGEFGANLTNLAHGLGGHFDWTLCIADGTFQGHGTMTTEFSECQTSNQPCGANHDVVGEYFIGNVSSFDQVTAYVDILEASTPTWASLPSDAILSCVDEFAEAISSESPVAVDACGETWVDSTVTFVAGDCPGEGRWDIEWTATNACGSSIQHIQQIHLIDEEAPTIYAPDQATFSCDEEVVFEPASAIDQCGNLINVFELPPTHEQGSCPFDETIIRHFQASDLCGNTAQASQIIEVRDITGPLLVLPNDTVMGCGSQFFLPQATATDNCSPTENISISYSTTFLPGDCPGAQIQRRRIVATDACGNQVEQYHTITITDIEPPTFTFVPEGLELSCDENPTLEAAIAEDACSDLTLSEDLQVVTVGCDGNEDWIRTFTAVDACGNERTAIQVLNFRDTTAPVFEEFPMNLTLSCDDNFTMELPIISDNCSSPFLSVMTDTLGNASSGNYLVELTYTASDACGNQNSQIQSVQYLDVTPPEFLFVPEDTVISCDDTIPMDLATAVDNCSDVTIEVYADTLPGSCPSNWTLMRTFVVTDLAGNVTQATQRIDVLDVTPPSLTLDEELTLSCESTSDMLDLPIVDDNCSSFELSFVESAVSGGCVHPTGQFLREFTAIDACGNSSTASQIITLVDDTPPVFTFVPEDITFSCDDPQGLDLVLAQAQDNCGDVTITHEDLTTEDDGNGNFSILRTFWAADDCGNVASATQTLASQDLTPPTFLSMLEDVILECGVPIPDTPVEVIDNCGEVSIIVEDLNLNPDSCQGGNVLRTITATDPSGNSAQESILFQRVDTTPPSWTFFPLDTTVACNDPLPEATPTAQDLCSGEVNVDIVTEIIPGDALGNLTVLHTYTATDLCGNQAQALWTISVVDLQAPVLVAPDSITVSCEDPLQVIPPSVSDECGNVTWTSLDEFVQGECNGQGTILRTYTATDDAGNQSEDIQVITLIDTTPPVFTFVPDTLWWTCDGEQSLDSALAMDGCSLPLLTASLDTLEDDGTFQPWLQITWTASDECGNESTAQHIIVVEDTQAPTLHAWPSDTTLIYGAPYPMDMWMDSWVVSDNCASIASLTFNHVIDTLTLEPACITEIEITWTISDPAGNESSHVQYVLLLDETPPNQTYIPEDELLSCSDPIMYSPPSYEDMNAWDWTDALDTIPGTCPSQFTIIRTFSAWDECGNESLLEVQTIEVTDTVSPTWTLVPEDALFTDVNSIPSCEESSLNWEDNCSNASWTCFTDTLEFYCPGSFLLARTFELTDDCGNGTIHVQNILVEDVAAPQWIDFPEDVILPCDSLSPNWDPSELTVVDNASSDVMVALLESNVEGNNCTWTRSTTYQATDGCGNSDQITHSVTWVDNEPPFLTAPLPPLSFLCVSEVPTCENTELTVEDACNEWTWSCSDVLDSACMTNNCQIQRTITLTDACDNESAIVQVIQIEEPPTVPELPTGFSPNNDNFNDTYRIANVGPDPEFPPCDWLEGTKLMVFDRWGSLVFETSDVTTPWDGTNAGGRPLPVGTYFVVFETQGASYRATVDLRQ
ncbi:MAG: gliding motility-associated C-terminal domain-containing protein [Bacteroidetes bacterium]|nr:gliding motility-associated C-terminal domain-containing protein [Bacteroidota bacterium]MDA0904074.1 gliding motility-associated C-terminal domain-containing protein [Bacteroidota bacterium]